MTTKMANKILAAAMAIGGCLAVSSPASAFNGGHMGAGPHMHMGGGHPGGFGGHTGGFHGGGGGFRGGGWGGDYYDNGAGAALGFGMLAIGAMAAAAAAQQQQYQYAAPVCTAPNGSAYYARAWRGRWVC